MFQKISFLIFLLFLQLINGQYAQDSLKTILKSSAVDATRLEAALGLSKNYVRVNLDSALHYAVIAEEIVVSSNAKSDMPRVRLQKAGVLLSKQDLINAEILLNENLKEPELKPQIRAKTYQNLGSISTNRGAFEKAINLYLDALTLFETENDSIGIAKVSANIGIVNSRLKNYGEGIAFLEKALLYASKDEMLNLQILVNLAGTYNDQSAFQKAIAMGNKAIFLAQKIDSPMLLGIVYSNLCNSYLGVKQYDAAIESGLKGIELKKQFGQNTDILLNNLGHAYLQKGEYNQAITYLSKVSPSATPNLKSLIYNNLGEAYGKLNDHKTAWHYAQMHKKINDSLNTIMLRERDSITGVIRTYETEKNAQAIDLLNTRNELNESKINAQRGTIWTIALLSMLLLALGGVIYKNQKNRQHYKTETLKSRLLRTQLNPHFLFNALNSMQGFNYADEKKKLSNYINSFSKLMRSILESSDQDFITVEEDANAIKEYLTLQRLSANEKFSAKVSIDDNLDTQILIPPMFTQPFVENAVIHGMKNRNDGNIDVSYQKKGENLVFVVKDNGIGSPNESTNASSKLHRSMSTDILNERIINLQKTNGYACEMHTASDKSGTTVTLTFPYNPKKIGVSLNHG